MKHFAADLTKSIEFMRANVACSLTLQELSRHAGLSPTRYSALFREQTDSSPVEHHIRLRMQAACHYLDTTALSVKEVAAKLGYDDPCYFSRIFQKILGCSPPAYRPSVKGIIVCGVASRAWIGGGAESGGWSRAALLFNE
ncbi:MAG: AraC family transcriptional regulator [Verrucomicrobia bacterium]|nr:AraC family transcriptional regulator [Verrucomicrobiota bacterium]